MMLQACGRALTGGGPRSVYADPDRPRRTNPSDEPHGRPRHAREQGGRIVGVPCGHDAMVDMSGELAELLVAASVWGIHREPLRL